MPSYVASFAMYAAAKHLFLLCYSTFLPEVVLSAGRSDIWRRSGELISPWRRKAAATGLAGIRERRIERAVRCLRGRHPQICDPNLITQKSQITNDKLRNLPALRAWKWFLHRRRTRFEMADLRLQMSRRQKLRRGPWLAQTPVGGVCVVPNGPV